MHRVASHARRDVGLLLHAFGGSVSAFGRAAACQAHGSTTGAFVSDHVLRVLADADCGHRCVTTFAAMRDHGFGWHAVSYKHTRAFRREVRARL